MRRKFFLYLISFFIFTLSFQKKVFATPLVMIDEFVPYPALGDEEWIELLNPDQDNALDLSGWRFVVYQGSEPNYTYRYEQDLSGSVPRGGFLTFATDNGARIPDDGACLVIFVSDTESIYAVKYGNGTCDSGAGEQDATAVSIGQGNSIYYNFDESTWNSATSPSRGWCNPGSGECPAVSTIVAQMSGKGVTTNLGDQTDFSRISGLYFEKTGQGKITFLSEMNLTDQDALSWMQSLDSKLSISQGIISLDAELIKNLTDTQASLAMFNISLNNPTIQVTNTDGSAGDSSIVSGLAYDRTAGNLTFTVAHFTTFTAIENSTTTSSGSPGPAVCGNFPPSNAPHLFRIDTTKNSATLYFSPANDHLDHYYVAYGYKEGDERFGVQYPAGLSTGVVNYTVGALSPNTTYYFKVRGGNGCASGGWSKWLMAKTEGGVTATVLVPTVGAKEAESGDETVITKEEQSLIPESKEVEPLPRPTVQLPVQEKVSFWQKFLNFFQRLFDR